MITKENEYIKKYKEEFKKLVDSLDNNDLIESSTKVNPGIYACPLCYEKVYIEELSSLPTCPICHYNFLYRIPNDRK